MRLGELWTNAVMLLLLLAEYLLMVLAIAFGFMALVLQDPEAVELATCKFIVCCVGALATHRALIVMSKSLEEEEKKRRD